MSSEATAMGEPAARFDVGASSEVNDDVPYGDHKGRIEVWRSVRSP